MKFKVDENLPGELADELRRLGHEADSVIEEGLQGAPDPQVVEAALRGGRVLLTLDKGIAQLSKYPMDSHGGVVLIRPDRSGRSALLEFVRARLGELHEHELAGRLTVVGPSRIRFR